MAPSFRSLFPIFAGLCALSFVATTPAPSRAADDAGFRGQFHTEDQTFIVIEDPLPHVKALLAIQAL
jgi:hypothetical protein